MSAMNETLLAFSAAKAQLEAGRELMRTARQTLSVLASTEQEQGILAIAIDQSHIAIVRLEHKIAYLSKVKAGGK